ncbi:sorting nexin-2-like [Centruroides vittatus]|uniref:sorting nexin-2-like n=1 Tax=Centruroides vittatus TaxID=120091 RepID=UPI00350EFBA4
MAETYIVEQECVNEVEYMNISVTNQQKVKSLAGSYVMYKIETTTNFRHFDKRTMTVTRRFGDFIGLYEKLRERYESEGRIIPPPPEKKTPVSERISRMRKTDKVSEWKTSALQRYLNRLARHPILKYDPILREFLELKSVIPRSYRRSPFSARTIRCHFKKLGESMGRIYAMDDDEPWFKTKYQHLDTLEDNLKKWLNSIATVICQRQALSSGLGEIARATALVAGCEENNIFSRLLYKVAEAQKETEELQLQEAESDYGTLYELIKDYIILLDVVKQIFWDRLKTVHLIKLDEQKLIDKVKRMHKETDYYKQECLRDIILQLESKIYNKKQSLITLSKVIREEFEHFEQTRLGEFESVINKRLESFVGTHQQMINYWKALLPEEHGID